MIAVDTNILVAFHRTEYATHHRAKSVITELAEGTAPWALPWPCIHEFLAVVTNPRIFQHPTGPDDAAIVVDALLESPVVRLLGEGPGYWKQLRSLVLQGTITGPRVHDARIAALCLTHRIECLWTADRDFNRFPTLKTRNPLIESD